MLYGMGKDFLLILPFITLSYVPIFPIAQAGKVRVGYNAIKFFERPGKEPKKFGNVRWITTFPVTQKPPIPLTATYSPQKYSKMQLKLTRNPPHRYAPSDIINVDTLASIPRDYKGKMAVPVTILEVNNSQFKLLGLVSNGYVKGRTVNGKLKEGLAKRVIIQRR